MARPRKNFDGDVEAESRLILPRGTQIIGRIELRLGFGKSRVVCTDGNVRICRVPGARRRDLWIRPGNVVLVEPWSTQSNERGDIIFQYTPLQIQRLKNMGLLKDLVLEDSL